MFRNKRLCGQLLTEEMSDTYEPGSLSTKQQILQLDP